MSKISLGFKALSFAVLLSSPAFAHMSISPKEAVAGSYVKHSFSVGHGCEGSPTTLVRIELPEGILFAKPQPKTGWTIETINAPYAKPVESHGKTYHEGVRTIVWKGGSLDDAYFDEFAFQAQLSKDLHEGPLYYKASQICAKGEHHWVDIPAKSGDQVKSPAPVMMVKASAAKPAMQKAGDVMIMEPWSRATPAGAKVAGGFMSLMNHGKTDDRLISATSPVTGRVEIHEMAMKDGVMVMRQLKDGLPIKAGEKVDLKPGSFHIMFMDLPAGFKEGESVKLTLTFEKGGKVDLTLPVRGLSGQPAEAHKH